jgi:DNA transposition AAA+ family ATPase
MKDPKVPFYVESTAFRTFFELCQACREQKEIGLIHGRPGVGKTEAALRYSSWTLVERNLALKYGQPIEPEKLSTLDTLYFKPSITVSPQKLKSELCLTRNRFCDAKGKALSWHSPQNWDQSGQVGLLILDEAHRLKYQALEELRDLQERWDVGIVLIGDPGMEMNLPRMFHFADRVRYAEPFDPLSRTEVYEYTKKQTEINGIPEPAPEVREAIAICTKGNPRTLGHFFALIQKILKINDDIVQEITPDVIETARELMLVGSTVKPIQPSLASAV